jgi:hypothetical protein
MNDNPSRHDEACHWFEETVNLRARVRSAETERDRFRAALAARAPLPPGAYTTMAAHDAWRRRAIVAETKLDAARAEIDDIVSPGGHVIAFPGYSDAACRLRAALAPDVPQRCRCGCGLIVDDAE